MSFSCFSSFFHETNTVFTLALLTVPGQPRSLEPGPVPYWPAFTLESLQASQFEAGAWFATRHWSTLTITVQNNGISRDIGCVSLVSYVYVCLYNFSNSNKEIYKKAASRTKDSYVEKAQVAEKSTSFGTHHCCSCPFRPTTVTVDT